MENIERSPCDQLVDLANSIGAESRGLVLGAEGSCAVKISDSRFVVTRRGARLSQCGPGDAVEMEIGAANDFLKAEQLPADGLAGALVEPEGSEPSPDALLYAHMFSLGSHPLAVHVQPIEVNQITSSPRARQFADRRTVASDVTACGRGYVLVPYADPGLPLARELQRKVMLWRDRHKSAPSLVLVQSHGLIVFSASVEQCMETISLIVKSARVFIGSAMIGGPVFLSPTNVLHLEQLIEPEG